MLKPVSALRRNVDGSLGSGRSQRRSVGGSVPRTHEERDRESAEDPYYSPITPRKLLSAPNWPVLEKMSAGRWACAVSERPSRENFGARATAKTGAGKQLDFKCDSYPNSHGGDEVRHGPCKHRGCTPRFLPAVSPGLITSR